MDPALQNRRARGAVWLALPLVAAGAVYATTLGAGFVYDDNEQILRNPWVKELRYLPRVVSEPVWAYRTTLPSNYYRPVQMGLYNLLWAASGGHPAAFHAANVGLHVLCTLAVALLVRRLSRSTSLASGAALLFAVHPLNSETVAWVACLPELTYALFVLVALYLHVAAWSAAPGRRGLLRGLAAAAFLVGTLSKETALMLVGLVPLLEAVVRPWWESRRERRSGARLRTAAAATAPYAVVAGGYLALRYAVVGGVAPLSRGTLGPLDALLNAPWLLLSYLGKLVLPRRLLAHHVFDPVTGATDPAFLLGLAGLVGVGALAWWLARRAPDLAFAVALACLPLVPVLYVPALGANAFAERYAYLPSAGVAWLVAGAACALARRLRAARPGPAFAALVAALALPAAAVTLSRTADWRDDRAVAEAMLRTEPRADKGYKLLANWHASRGEPEAALEVVRRGLAALPHDAVLQSDAVRLRLELGRISLDEAIAAYTRLAEAYPTHDVVHFNLGQAHLEAGALDAARRSFARTLELYPNADRALVALAVIASREGRDGEAVELCRAAIAIDSGASLAWQQLGVSLLRLDDVPAAVAALERAVSLSPRDPEALNRLGVAYVRGGRREDARGAWQAALDIDPRFTKARLNLERLERGP